MAVEPAGLFPSPSAGELTAFRWSSYDVPFWARENSTDGRWNYARHGSTQYWSLTPDAAWSELIRHEGLASEAELDLVRMPFWVARLTSAGLIDLRRSDTRERFDIEEDDLTSDDWDACQRLGDVLRDQARGVIAPSAALPEHANLTIFGPRRAIDWDSRPALASAVPASRAALGRPPEGLVGRVRHRDPSSPGDRLF